MTTKSSNTPADRKDSTPEIQKLRDTVRFMDNLSQNGFSEITAIARLALASLETPEGHHNLQCIVYAFRLISEKAQDVEGAINSMAEEVGCNYKDDALLRSYKAQYEAEVARGGRHD